jgi:hypothetical protein
MRAGPERVFWRLGTLEQMVPEVEESQTTNGYDPELEALKILEFALQPVTPTIEPAAVFAMTLLGLELPGSAVPGIVFHSFSSPLPLTQPRYKRLCTYRI